MLDASSDRAIVWYVSWRRSSTGLGKTMASSIMEIPTSS